MPAEGIMLIPRSELLNLEELVRLTGIFLNLGISKIRVTGGEPFMRKGVLEFLETVRHMQGLKSLYITTNGVNIAPLVPQLKKIGISGVNLSLDTLDRRRFERVAQSDALEAVLTTYHALLKHRIPLKINTVVMKGVNIGEIPALVRLAQIDPIEMRFIEEMPSLVAGRASSDWDARRIIERLRSLYPEMTPLPSNGSTARRFSVPGFTGSIAVIAGNSRSFCSTCNRIRVTASGLLKTCLFDQGVLNIKTMFRSGAGNGDVEAAIRECALNRLADGFEASRKPGRRSDDSMSSIGG